MPRVNTRLNIARLASESTGISLSDCAKILDAAITGMTAELGQGNCISFREFGTFKLVHRNERLARIPRKGHYDPNVMVEIPAHTAVFFKPCPPLKLAVLKLAVGKGRVG